jgi:hypothetical protein
LRFFNRASVVRDDRRIHVSRIHTLFLTVTLLFLSSILQSEDIQSFAGKTMRFHNIRG